MPIDPWLLAVIIIIVVVCIYFVVLWGIRAHKRKIEAGKEELIGKMAVVEIALNPKGVVLVEGERWNAVIDKGQVEPEEEVVITGVDGLKLIVTKK
ncbi:MAG: serine protease [Dehalococcoidales bacterium]|nr:serine protease [Dehalococcoidales bacterium]